MNDHVQNTRGWGRINSGPSEKVSELPSCIFCTERLLNSQSKSKSKRVKEEEYREFNGMGVFCSNSVGCLVLVVELVDVLVEELVVEQPVNPIKRKVLQQHRHSDLHHKLPQRGHLVSEMDIVFPQQRKEREQAW